MYNKMLVLDKVDSTNNYAMAMVQNALNPLPRAVFALEQTNGKGRRGKKWESHKGENIILSVPIAMQWLTLARQFELSVAVALSCYELLAEQVPAKVFIKWPNDIFINDSKAGGILIENVVKGTLWQWTVIGIGININQENFDGLIQKATSLKNITGKTFNVIELAERLLSILEKKIDFLSAGHFDKMLEEYNSNLFARGKAVRLKKQNALFETIITGVSGTGELITKDSIERQFNFDEVEFNGII